MSALTYAQFVSETDAIAAAYLRALGSGTSGLGTLASQTVGDVGARGRIGTQLTAAMALADEDRAAYIDAVDAAADLLAVENAVKPGFKALLDALDALIIGARIVGVTTISGFANYYCIGAGGPYLALLCPDFRTVYNLVRGSYPLNTNCYSPAVTSMASRSKASSVAAAFVAGTDVDASLYAGAARLQAVITSFAGAAGVLQVIGNGRTAAGVAVTGRVWSANVTANGTVTLLPAVAGDICYKVTDIQWPASITDGAATIAAAIPAGRANPPS